MVPHLFIDYSENKYYSWFTVMREFMNKKKSGNCVDSGALFLIFTAAKSLLTRPKGISHSDFGITPVMPFQE